MQPVPRPEYMGKTFGDAIDYIPQCWSALDKANNNLNSIREYVEKEKTPN